MYQLKFTSSYGHVNTLTVADFSDVCRSILLVDSFVPFLFPSAAGYYRVSFTLTRYRASSRSLDRSSSREYHLVWTSSSSTYNVFDSDSEIVARVPVSLCSNH